MGSGFALYWNPSSVEFPDLSSRNIHSSYPPGVVLPAYAASRLIGREPGIALLQGLNAAGQVLIAWFLALTVFVTLRWAGCGLTDACILSLIAVCLECFLPAPFHAHHQGYFTYEAVLPLYAGFVACEVFRDRIRSRRMSRILMIAQAVVGFLGMLTDWLFLLVVSCTYLKRLLSLGKGKRLRGLVSATAELWLPVALALGLFAVDLAVFGGYGYLRDRFYVRTARSIESPFWRVRWFYNPGHMTGGYGSVGIKLLWLSLAGLAAGAMYLAMKRLRKAPPDPRVTACLSLSFLALAPCVLYGTLLPGQIGFWLHLGEAVKFSIPLAVIPFVMLPAIVVLWLGLEPSSLTLNRLLSITQHK